MIALAQERIMRLAETARSPVNVSFDGETLRAFKSIISLEDVGRLREQAQVRLVPFGACQVENDH